jgi:flagellar biosynthesis chaperone FliJ
MAENPGTQALFDLWKKQMEEGTQAWARMMSQGQTVDPNQFWRPFMDQGMAVWSKLFTQGPVTPEFLSHWKQFLDQWIAAWSKVLEQAMGTEAFAQALGKHLEQWLSLQEPMKKATEESAEAVLSALGIPARSQVVGISRQLDDLEDRIECLDDRMSALMAKMDDLLKTLAHHKPSTPRRTTQKGKKRDDRTDR